MVRVRVRVRIRVRVRVRLGLGHRAGVRVGAKVMVTNLQPSVFDGVVEGFRKRECAVVARTTRTEVGQTRRGLGLGFGLRFGFGLGFGYTL